MNNENNNFNQDFSNNLNVNNEVNNNWQPQNPEMQSNTQNNETVESVYEQPTIINEPMGTVDTQPVTNPEDNNVVEPIPEVKVEEETVEVSASKKTYEIPKAEKSPRLTTFLLVTFFILLFAYVMAMPYIDEWLVTMQRNKEEQRLQQQEQLRQQQLLQTENKNTSTNQQTPVVEENYSKLTCSKADTITDYTTLTEETFDYNKDNQVIKSTQKITYTFTVQNAVYTSLIQQCNDSLKYIGKDGYTMSCNNTDTQVVIGNEFDLETFKAITDGTTTISANATYKDSIDTVKTRLTAAGYTCK